MQRVTTLSARFQRVTGLRHPILPTIYMGDRIIFAFPKHIRDVYSLSRCSTSLIYSPFRKTTRRDSALRPMATLSPVTWRSLPTLTCARIQLDMLNMIAFVNQYRKKRRPYIGVWTLVASPLATVFADRISTHVTWMRYVSAQWELLTGFRIRLL
jgi:hypothetical protein